MNPARKKFIEFKDRSVSDGELDGRYYYFYLERV